MTEKSTTTADTATTDQTGAHAPSGFIPKPTAADWFGELEAIGADMPARDRYAVAGRVLRLAVDWRLRGVRTAFAGLLPKIQYLFREHNVRDATVRDRSLERAMNDVRLRLRHLADISDTELEEAWSTDLKAVCRFVALISGCAVPEKLERQFPLYTEHRLLPRMRDGLGHAMSALRCTVERWDANGIYGTRADSGDAVTVGLGAAAAGSSGDYSYLLPLLYEGAQLSVVRPHEEGGVVYGELLVLDPDNLVNVTAVAACFEDYGCSARLAVVNRLKPGVSSRAILLGLYAGQLLDEAVYGSDVTYAESMSRFFCRHALAFACCPDELGADFHRDAQRQREIIGDIIGTSLMHKRDHRPVTPDEIVLEPSFVCPVLGLQGRMDLIHLGLDIIVEQKGGKAAMGSVDGHVRQQQKHYVQLLLYRALFHYAYSQLPYADMASYLLYSRYEGGLVELGSAPQLLHEAMKVRNQIAWSERRWAEHGMDFLATMTADSIFPNCNATLWQRYQRPDIDQLFAALRLATPLERAYCLRLMRFVACEHMLAKVGSRTKEVSGFATTWTASVDEKRLSGNIYERLVMEPMAPCGEQEDIVFVFGDHSRAAGADMSNFRVGDIVMFYPYRRDHEPDATASIVFRSTVTDIRTDRLCVRLRNPQNTCVFDFYNRQNMCWAVEHDFMEASFTSLYRGLYAFLAAPKERRDLVLGLRQPAVDATTTLHGDYGSFNSLALSARQAQDLFLIIGPPGTGKTSFGMLNVLKEQLLEPGSSVLLTAYTNRAVDEICSKLVESDIDFIRLGSDFSCAPQYRSHLLHDRVEALERVTVDGVRQLITGARVVCGTVTAFSAHTELFGLRGFDLAIVDEASQILEPHLIGLLGACHDGKPAIGRFVLIGDEKQLPAVVQQEQSESAVEEPELRAIGLTDCRLSFFERMLRMHGKDNPSTCFLLRRQGRMHPSIADFPNRAFYGNMLQPVPLPHQSEPAAETARGNDWVEDMLLTHRLAFVSCDPYLGPDEADKVNSAEAETIAAVAVTARRMAGDTYDAATTVGVIVPYRNQIATVRTAIDKAAHAAGFDDMHDIAIDTVERYQGSQRDVIVYGFTAKRPYQLAFLTDTEYYDATDNAVIDRKLNVAMTRARKRLVMVGYAPLLMRDTTFRRLIEYAREKKAFFKGKKVKR